MSTRRKYGFEGESVKWRSIDEVECTINVQKVADIAAKKLHDGRNSEERKEIRQKLIVAEERRMLRRSVLQIMR